MTLRLAHSQINPDLHQSKSSYTNTFNTYPSRHRTIHDSFRQAFVSRPPSLSIGLTGQSRRSDKKHTASVIATFSPRRAHGPKCHRVHRANRRVGLKHFADMNTLTTDWLQVSLDRPTDRASTDASFLLAGRTGRN